MTLRVLTNFGVLTNSVTRRRRTGAAVLTAEPEKLAEMHPPANGNATSSGAAATPKPVDATPSNAA